MKKFLSVDNSIIKTLINSELDKYKDMYELDKYGSKLNLEQPEIIRFIIETLDEIDFESSSIDSKGSAFEFFLNHRANDDLAQYFTPKQLVQFMVKYLSPKIGEKLYDPFCGSGGILIQAYKYMLAQNPTDKELKFLKKESLIGSDISSIAYIAKMNMILMGDGHSNISRNKKGTESVPQNEIANIVITNIPFNINSNFGDLYNMPNAPGNAVMVKHTIDSLMHNGRAGIIVPETFITNNTKYENLIRGEMIKKFDIDVVPMPQGVFSPYTTAAKSAIIFLNPKSDRNFIKYYDIKNVGFTLDKYKKPTKYNQLREIIRSPDSLDFVKKISVNFAKQNNNILKWYPVTNGKVQIKDILKLAELKKINFGEFVPNKKYKEITVRNHGNGTAIRKYGKGIDKKNYILGKNIKTKRSVVKEGQFIVSLIDARNGSMGKIGSEINNALTSTSYRVFDLKKEYSELNLDFFTKIMTTESKKDFYEGISIGSTNRRSIKETNFLDVNISYSKEELLQANKKFIELKKTKEILKEKINEIEIKIKKLIK